MGSPAAAPAWYWRQPSVSPLSEPPALPSAQPKLAHAFMQFAIAPYCAFAPVQFAMIAVQYAVHVGGGAMHAPPAPHV
jgi:hypothetical protein